jgi:hypothetical protein
MGAILVPVSFWHFLQEQGGTPPLMSQAHIPLVLVEDFDIQNMGPKPAAGFKVIDVEDESV